MSEIDLTTLLMEIILKVSTLLVLCIIACLVLYQATPSIRRFLWSSTLILCLALLPAVTWLPEYAVDVSAIPLLESTIVNRLHSEKTPKNTDLLSATSNSMLSNELPSSGTDLTPERSNGFSLALISLWAIGSLLIIAYTIFNFRHGARLLSTATILDTSNQLLPNPHYRPEILIAKDLSSPVCVGIFHPRILLPADFNSWDEQQKNCAILHECAHAVGKDNLHRVIALCACAVFWFHPLIWFAYYKLKQEQEMNADNFVLNLNVKPSFYAETLIEVVRKIKANEQDRALVTDMGSYSFFPSRMKQILASDRRRDPITTVQTSIATLVMFICFISIASVTGESAFAHTDLPVPVAVSVDSSPETPPILTTVKLSTTTTTSPLYRSVLSGNMKSIEILLLSGEDPNQVVPGIELPLHLAIDLNNYSVVELLLEGGANPNLANLKGELPLNRALTSSNTQLFELLLEAQANPKLKTLSGVTPIEYAKNNDMTKFVELLLSVEVSQ